MDPEATLRQQLAMNRETWKKLQEHGVDETTELRLDFFYDGPGEAEANELAAFLRAETDYEVAVDPEEGWAVNGTTRATTISLEILDDWVRWMVAAGAEHGGCEFDGWGAQVPE